MIRRNGVEKDKISVIVPIYKVERYLDRCVKSICHQEYKNLEIILVDDGSPDNCGKMCDEYAKEDSRIKVIHKANGGLSDARNAGIEISTGEYILFVDSDDWIDKRMIRVLYTALQRYNADIAECSWRNIYSDCIIEETTCTGKVVESDNVSALEGMLDWKYFKPVAWDKLYKRSVIADIRYPKGKIHEDEYTTYKYVYNAKKLVYVDFSFYNYDRTRTDSITGDKFKEANLDACWAFRERVEFFEKHGIKKLGRKMNDIYCWVVLDKAYKCYCDGIRGEKTEMLVEQVKEDVVYLQQHEVDPWYINEFRILEKGIEEYGKVRSERERKS